MLVHFQVIANYSRSDKSHLIASGLDGRYPAKAAGNPCDWSRIQLWAAAASEIISATRTGEQMVGTLNPPSTTRQICREQPPHSETGPTLIHQCIIKDQRLVLRSGKNGQLSREIC